MELLPSTQAQGALKRPAPVRALPYEKKQAFHLSFCRFCLQAGSPMSPILLPPWLSLWTRSLISCLENVTFSSSLYPVCSRPAARKIFPK